MGFLRAVPGQEREVWDDVSPTGKPGGLAIRGRVRNWARLVKGKPVFGKDALSEMDCSQHERKLVARAAGRVVDLAEMDSPRPENARTDATRPSDGPEYPQQQDRTSTRLIGARPPEAA